MFKRLCREFFLGVALLFMLCLGFATPALAQGEPTYAPSDAKLTAVIVAPIGTDASQDEYVFHFAGGGNVTAGTQEESGKTPVYSGGVEQDNTTIKAGDVVPIIGDEDGNVTLTGIKLTDANSLTNGQLGQTVVQKSLSEILTGVTFPHAGIYTYDVTETSASSITSKAHVTRSLAKYRLRIWVKNAKTGNQSVLDNKELEIAYVTVERLAKDDGTAVQEKVIPTNPTKDDDGKITTQGSETSQFVGDAESGRNVPGFTFANEYTTTGPLQVKKLYDGDHSDRTRYSTVELAVHSSTVMPSGSVLTYKIEGGKDLIEGRSKLDGVSGIDQVDHYMAEFDAYGWCYIKADLKEGDSIRITGEFGPLENGEREILSTNGLFRGQFYYVVERNVGDYRPTGYEYVGEGSADPRTNSSGMTKTAGNGDTSEIDIRNEISSYPVDHLNNDQAMVPFFGLFMQGTASGSDTTIFVVNKLDEAKVSPTGIFFDNLPYILMIGVPLLVFAGMFVARRRGNVA